MIPILKQSFRSRRTSLIVYCCVMVWLIVMYTALYPAIKEQSAALSKTLESLGGAVKAFGVTEISFDTLEKFLSIELFGITWPILMITFVTARAGQAIAGEIEQHTMGTLLALPVSRSNLFLAKYFAGLIALAIFVATSTLLIIPVAAAFGTSVATTNVVSVFVLCFLFSWAIYSFGLVLSAAVSEKGRVYTVVGGVLLIMYVANVLSAVSKSLHWMQYWSVFHYFNAADVLSTNSVNMASYGLFAAIIVISTISGLAVFGRRDVIV